MRAPLPPRTKHGDRKITSGADAVDEITVSRILEWDSWFMLRDRRRGYFFFKALTDQLLALTFLILFSPILALCALAIYVECGRPVLFLQTRYGLFGMPFRVFKFRTMLEVDGKLRVTRSGAFMRKYKLDELPQLVNVLIGDMSLVGPRPLPTTDMARISHRRLDRFAVRPGLTGLWQALHTNLIPISRKQRLDSIYAQNCSLKLDLWLILRTPAMVLKGEDQWVRRQEDGLEVGQPERKAG